MKLLIKDMHFVNIPMHLFTYRHTDPSKMKILKFRHGTNQSKN